jgi:hypothetical protein
MSARSESASGGCEHSWRGCCSVRATSPALNDGQGGSVMSKALPHARQHGLVVRELPDEVLVYDLERQHGALPQFHCGRRLAV